MSGRTCSFTSQTLPETLSVATRPTSSNGSQSTSLSVSHSREGTTPVPGIADSPHDNIVNLDHMELLIHVTCDQSMFNLGDQIDNTSLRLTRGLEIALENPYLLYQLLAFSARHLAFLHPDRSASYMHQAVTLQTRAISLFNAAKTEIDQSNCVAVLLFSTALGHHLLADTLAKQDSGGLEAFLSHYVQCVDTNWGIYKIAMTAWPLLQNSELASVLAGSSEFTSQTPKGTQCDEVKRLVEGSASLAEEQKDVLRRAIRYLQVGFDAVLCNEEPTNRHQMIFKWTMLAPPEFTALLMVKRPEALVLLAYYALLLHYGRSMWQVGNAGVYILDLVGDFLGPKWDPWLEYPLSMVREDSRPPV